LIDELWQRLFAGEFNRGELMRSRFLRFNCPRPLWYEGSHWDAIGRMGVPMAVRPAKDDEECSIARELLLNYGHLAMPKESADAGEN